MHLGYFRAGADCGITASYQATIPGLTARGYSRQEAEDCIARSVELFREARESWWAQEGRDSGRARPLCLGAVGPYGAYLADGSEYRGNYGVSDDVLRDFHRRRMEILWEAGSDLLLLETQPSLHEALIEADIAEELGADYWISFSCRDGSHIHEGDRDRRLRRRPLPGPPPPADDRRQLHTAPVRGAPHRGAERFHFPAYRGLPQQRREYDPATKTWHGSRDGVTFGDYAHRWMRAGAKAVGGCCRTVDSHIREVAKAREIYLKLGR